MKKLIFLLFIIFVFSCESNYDSSSDFEDISYNEVVTSVQVYYQGVIISEGIFSDFYEWTTHAPLEYRFENNDLNTRMLSNGDYLIITEEKIK